MPALDQYSHVGTILLSRVGLIRLVGQLKPYACVFHREWLVELLSYQSDSVVRMAFVLIDCLLQLTKELDTPRKLFHMFEFQEP